MIRMTLALSLAIYTGLVVWGGPAATEAASAGTSPDTGATIAASTGPGHDRPVILPEQAAPAPQVTRAAPSPVVAPTIAAAAKPRAIGEPQLISLIAADDPVRSTGTDATPAPLATGPLLRVSGDRVNMRSGPSTAYGVVNSLPSGTLAEPMGEPSGGWIEVRVVETGVTGFMAARFLDPA